MALTRDQRRNVLLVLSAVLARYLGFVIMTILALLNERRPAPRLPDFVLDRVAYDSWLSGINYWLWLLAWVPPTLLFCFRDPRRASRCLFVCGILSIVRGLCLHLTGLGPPRGEDLNAGLGWDRIQDGILAVANPIAVFVHDKAFVYLTKDLFFSGHVATTFLLLLYCWRDRLLRFYVLPFHLAVTWSVLAAHMHYSIDVVGAYAITFSAFVIAERWRPAPAPVR